jgi:hypothetical protein
LYAVEVDVQMSSSSSAFSLPKSSDALLSPRRSNTRGSSSKRPFTAISANSSSSRKGARTPFSSRKTHKFNTISTTTPLTRKTYSRVTSVAESEHIKVMVRLRPSRGESDPGHSSCMKVESDTTLSCLTTSKRSRHNVVQDFTFDKIFGPQAGGQSIYETCGIPVVQRLMEGSHGAIMAYGQTGSGKTHTMTEMIPLVVEKLFQEVSESKEAGSFSVTCSYLQIYNERISDLLLDNAAGGNLRLRGRGDGSMRVEGLSEQPARNAAETLALLEEGHSRRTVAATNMNMSSSRSHAIFIIALEYSIEGKTRTSRLHLVDLAGSESQKTSQTEGKRLKEASGINKSLSALGNVINALVSKHTTHVPYRDSKLTRVLEQALGGKGFSVLIATVASEVSNIAETQSTLKFAQRARQVSNIIVTEKLVDNTPASLNSLAASASASGAALDTKHLQLHRELMVAKAAMHAMKSKEAKQQAVFEKLDAAVQTLCAENSRLTQAVLDCTLVFSEKEETHLSNEQEWAVTQTTLNQTVRDLRAAVQEAESSALEAKSAAAAAASSILSAAPSSSSSSSPSSATSVSTTTYPAFTKPRSASIVDVDHSGCIVLPSEDEQEDVGMGNEHDDDALEPAPKKRKKGRFKGLIHSIKKLVRTPKKKRQLQTERIISNENEAPSIAAEGVEEMEVEEAQPERKKYNFRRRKASSNDEDYVHYSFR